MGNGRITDPIDRRIRAMRCRRYTVEAIAADVGLTPAQVELRIRAIWQASERESSVRRPDDPTPEEIAERAAECRQRWSETDFLVRRGLAVPSGRQAGLAASQPHYLEDGHWRPPVITARDMGWQ